ncbi:MAG: aspartyl protease family protein [Candidatus Thorarchaeota archaeon]
MKTLKIDFEISPQTGHIDIPVNVNGEGPLRFTLDTGAVATTVTTSLAEKLGIKTQNDNDGKYEGLGFEYAVGNLDAFGIGTEVRENEEILVFDMKALLGISDRISGNVGHSTLKDYVLSINYSKKTLRLDRGDYGGKEPSSWTDFNYISDTHLLGVPVQINGKGPFDLVLDTGSPIIALTPKLSDEIGLELGDSGVMVKGLGGTTGANFVTLESVSVGNDKQLDSQALVVDLSAVSRRGSLMQYGIIGATFLKHYEVIIDYPRKKLGLIPSTG